MRFTTKQVQGKVNKAVHAAVEESHQTVRILQRKVPLAYITGVVVGAVAATHVWVAFPDLATSLHNWVLSFREVVQ